MITVVSPTAFKINEHAIAIERTMDALPLPSKGLLISTEKPSIPFRGQWAPISKDWIPRGQWDKREYSIFMLQGLIDYIDTEFVVTVQWDGYALNRKNWDNRFLQYDYIGAPWPKWLNIARVGNGGFSLRSRRWIAHAANPMTSPDFNSTEVRGSEDQYFCVTYRSYYESAGLRIAPIEVAQRWAFEHPIEELPKWSAKMSFGFHNFNLKANQRYQIYPYPSITLVYVHVLNDKQGEQWARRFVASLHKFSPGNTFKLVVVFNKGPSQFHHRQLYQGIKDIEFLEHDNTGWDIGAFRLAAKNCTTDMMLCCGSHVYARRNGWLLRLSNSWRLHGPGLYGPFGSYEVNRHIRTSAFACPAWLVNDYNKPTRDRDERYDFEHGTESITKRAIDRGLPIWMVTWKADRGINDWRKDNNIFRRGNQSDLILFDHLTDEYESATPERKSTLSRYADGLEIPT